MGCHDVLTFENIQELVTAQKLHWEQQLVCIRKEQKLINWLLIDKWITVRCNWVCMQCDSTKWTERLQSAPVTMATLKVVWQNLNSETFVVAEGISCVW